MINKKHFDLFLRDHTWVILLFLCSSLSSMIVFITMKDGGIGEQIYYAFLPVVILLLFLGYRLYVTWNYYKLILKDADNIDQFMVAESHCGEEENMRNVIQRMHALTSAEILRLEETQSTQKTMIYQWVHQLKTPLSIIHLITQNHSGEEDWIKIRKAVGEIQYDLKQLLSLYRLDKLESDFSAEKTQLYQVAANCINELKSSFIEHEAYPRLAIDPDIHVYTDPKWLGFILYQILTNAIKYGGDHNHIIISAAENNETVLLSVQDFGSGINKEDIGRIFDLFFTGQNGRVHGESSGMGLYMAKKAADFLGHELTVESEPNKGSRFTILFRN